MFYWIQNSETLNPLNKLAAVDRVETRWRRHLPNPFLKHGEMQTYLAHFEHERFL